MTEFQPTENDPLGRLLSELVNGDPTSASLEELATLLRDDPQSRLDYVRWISLHADFLRRQRMKSAGGSEQLSRDEAAVAPFVSLEETNHGKSRHFPMDSPSSRRRRSPVLGFLHTFRKRHEADPRRRAIQRGADFDRRDTRRWYGGGRRRDRVVNPAKSQSADCSRLARPRSAFSRCPPHGRRRLPLGRRDDGSPSRG